jgi:CubicO group peptidase (beta-lactamase class C family)
MHTTTLSLTAMLLILGLTGTAPPGRVQDAPPPTAPQASPGASKAEASGARVALASSPEERRAAFTRAADYSAGLGGRAVLVMVDGQVEFERADNGWSLALPHMLASGTKSFTGVMAMLAVQDGLITLDERVADTITEWRSDPRKSRITVRHLLELSSGLAPSDAQLGGRGGGRALGELAERRSQLLDRQRGDQPLPDNHFRAAVEVRSLHEPGSRFQYGPSHFYAFGEFLQRKLAASDQPHKTVLAYLHERLLKPVGIEVARIGRDRAGNPNLPGGMALTAREWARFGQFVLDGGSVLKPDGTREQILRPELLGECFVPSKTNPAYGLTWWLRTGATGVADGRESPEPQTNPQATPQTGPEPTDTRRPPALERLVGDRLQQMMPPGPVLGPDGQPITVYLAAGLGNQRLYILPQFNLVAVRFAEASTRGRAYDDVSFVRLLLGMERQVPDAAPRRENAPATSGAPASPPQPAPQRRLLPAGR